MGVVADILVAYPKFILLFLLTQGPDFVGGSNVPTEKLDFPGSPPEKCAHESNFWPIE